MLAFVTVTGFSQIETTPKVRTITVTGSAELEIVPDEIYIEVQLKEYEKQGSHVKVSIDKIKRNFLAGVQSAGIPDSLVTVASYTGYSENYWWRRHKKDEESDMFATITYQLKLKSTRQMDDLVNTLDDDATENFYITKTNNSRATEIRKQLKIDAIKAAKDKALYLTGAIDEKLGHAITITETDNSFVPYYFRSVVSNSMSNSVNTASGGGGNNDNSSAPGFNKIKYRFEVTVIFELD